MPVLYNTGDWFTLGHGNTYRKIELYNMEWPPETDLENMIVCAAPYGGPMAIVKDFQKFVKVTGSTKPIIRIFTASGHLISSINWNSGNLLSMGWSECEELICVQDDGLVLIYDMFGVYQHTFSMGQEAKDTKVIDAKIFPSGSGTGVAVMTTNFRVFLVNSVKEPKNRQLPEMPKSIADPNCWDIVTEERNTFALVSREREIFKLQQGVSVCMPVNISMQNDYKSFLMMSVSFNQRDLALYTNSGHIWMGSSNLKTKYCEFDTGRTERPKQIEWCVDAENSKQSGALIVTYSSLLLIIGISGDSNVYTYDPAIFLIPEMDCVRVLTNGCHEVIQKIPKCVTNIFAINSQESSSFLFEAHKKYLEKSHQSDEYLCLIKDSLELAVSECIDAAGYEFDPETQKSLIRAAYFGKAFCSAHNPDKYNLMCRILRVLNSIRHAKVGIPLTIRQFNHLKPNVILDRLVFRKHYALAIQIAKHLKMPESRILEHWALHKVMYDKHDEEVARKIAEKFRNPIALGVSFCTIAKKAQETGRTKLAIMLLDQEPKASARVPLLLKLGENKKALLSATHSGDTDLVYMVLLQLKETTQLADFQMTVRSFPMAQNLFKKYCQQYNVSALKDIFTQEDDFASQAEFSLREGFAEMAGLETALSITANAYKKAHQDLEAELCEEGRKLIKQQKVFSEKHSKSFYGLSVHETIKQLLTLGDLKTAEKIRSEYKVPDRRFWWLRIQVLSDHYQWEELEKFSKIKKSPIGYEPFVEVCVKKQNIDEARKYLPKCREDKKVKWYIRAGLSKEAALAAFELKDLQNLYIIHMNASKTNDRQLINTVENYINQLSPKK
ncbi:Vacuolar protein sorting-associated protein 16 homolog [Sergentomyia squamirostris]